MQEREVKSLLSVHSHTQLNLITGKTSLNDVWTLSVIFSCDDISNRQYLQTSTRNKTDPEVNGCLARPYLNIEYKGKVSSQYVHWLFIKYHSQVLSLKILEEILVLSSSRRFGYTWFIGMGGFVTYWDAISLLKVKDKIVYVKSPYCLSLHMMYEAAWSQLCSFNINQPYSFTDVHTVSLVLIFI